MSVERPRRWRMGMVAEAVEWADASRQRVGLRVCIWYAYAYVPPYPGRRHRGLVAAIGDNPVYFGTSLHVEEQVHRPSAGYVSDSTVGLQPIGYCSVCLVLEHGMPKQHPTKATNSHLCSVHFVWNPASSSYLCILPKTIHLIFFLAH